MRAIVVAALFLVACQNASPEQRSQYLLRADPIEIADAGSPGAKVGLSSVRVAPYLKQSGIIVEDRQGRLHPARYHHWAEPLDYGLRNFLRDEISRKLETRVGDSTAQRGSWDYTVDVMFDELHGTMDGRARLSATFELRSRDEEPTVGSFSSSQALANEGYPALVDAQKKLVSKLAAEISAALVAAGLLR